MFSGELRRARGADFWHCSRRHLLEMNWCLCFLTRCSTSMEYLCDHPVRCLWCVFASGGIKFQLTALGLHSPPTDITTKGKSWSGWTDGDLFTSLGKMREDGGNQRSDSLVNLYRYMCVPVCFMLCMPSAHLMFHGCCFGFIVMFADCCNCVL